MLRPRIENGGPAHRALFTYPSTSVNRDARTTTVVRAGGRIAASVGSPARARRGAPSGGPRGPVSAPADDSAVRRSVRRYAASDEAFPPAGFLSAAGGGARGRRGQGRLEARVAETDTGPPASPAA